MAFLASLKVVRVVHMKARARLRAPTEELIGNYLTFCFVIQKSY